MALQTKKLDLNMYEVLEALANADRAQTIMANAFDDQTLHRKMSADQTRELENVLTDLLGQASVEALS